MPVPGPLTVAYDRSRSFNFNFQVCTPYGTWVQLDNTLRRSYLIGRQLNADLFTTEADRATWRLFAQRARMLQIFQ